MKITKNDLNNAWKIILLPALIAIFGSVANHFGYTFETQKAQESEQPANISSTPIIGLEGGIHINNYIPQPPVAQSFQQNSLGIEEVIRKEQKRLVSQNSIQEIGNGNTNSSQVIGDNNKVVNSSETDSIKNIEEQINTERYIQTEQYNENNGSYITNCVGNHNPCSKNSTTNINLAQ